MRQFRVERIQMNETQFRFERMQVNETVQSGEDRSGRDTI